MNNYRSWNVAVSSVLVSKINVVLYECIDLCLSYKMDIDIYEYIEIYKLICVNIEGTKE